MAAQIEGAEFAVGHQLAVGEHGAANAGAQGEDDDHTLLALAVAKAHLGNPGRVGIVEHGNRPAGEGRQPLGHRIALPARDLVGRKRGAGHAVLHHRRKTNAQWAVVVGKRGHQVGHRRQHILHQKRFGRGDAQPFANQLAPIRIYQGGLNAGTTNIYT